MERQRVPLVWREGTERPMNVRLVPHGHPNRTVLYTSITSITCDGETLLFWGRTGEAPAWALLGKVAEILLDEDGADP